MKNDIALEKPKPSGPECHRCKSNTLLVNRIADPVTSKKYDLFRCAVCENQVWSPVTERP
jgi:hypothetical protein